MPSLLTKPRLPMARKKRYYRGMALGHAGDNLAQVATPTLTLTMRMSQLWRMSL